jgi:hypothetical protein
VKFWPVLLGTGQQKKAAMQIAAFFIVARSDHQNDSFDA